MSESLTVLAVIVTLIIGTHSWQYNCESGNCKRNNEGAGYPSLELCQLMCTAYLNIWPYPTKSVSSVKTLIDIDPDGISFEINGPQAVQEYLSEVVNYFKKHLKEPSQCEKDQYPLKIILRPQSEDLDLTINTDESYNLSIDQTDLKLSVSIHATTVFGVRHGLETLLQLLVLYGNNGKKCLATLNYIRIDDKPVYRHRGLLIDTARNFQPIKNIKRTIDGMAASKLNVLHWHITDSQSFPLEAPSLPNMTRYGAYSAKETYSPETIRDIQNYAKIRGIRILLEIDGPSHAGNGWQWGSEAGLGNLALCVNEQPWRSYCIQPPCGQLNPANPKVYTVLETLFSDISDILGDISMFHFGGDEVYIACWNSSSEIIKYLKNKPLTEKTYLELWAQHQSKVLAAFDGVVGNTKTPAVVWTSTLTDPQVIVKYLPKDRYIIHTWVPESELDLITNLLNLGYQVIISTKDKWYLDHGFWGATTYHKWEDVYDNTMYSYVHRGVLGGEVCMWGELVDGHNIDSRIWPRAAAAAERLWSNPKTTSAQAKNRFYAQRERLLRRGIQAEAVITRWCVQNQGDCEITYE